MSPASGGPPVSPEPSAPPPTPTAANAGAPATVSILPNAAWVSHEGYRRPNNEDRGLVFDCPLGRVLIICDGMGGHEGGEKAADISLDVFHRMLSVADTAADVAETLRACLANANSEILAWRKSRPALRNMGSTVVVAVVQKSLLHVAHVGDSRAYMARGANLVRLTRDQTLVQDFIERGHITEDEARTHPFGNALKQAVGQDNEPVLEVSRPFPLAGGDLIFLCSDGLTGYVKDATLQKVLGTGLTDPSLVVEAFLAVGLAAGGHDNITIAAARVDGLPLPRNDETQKLTVPSAGRIRIPNLKDLGPNQATPQPAAEIPAMPTPPGASFASRFPIPENLRRGALVVAGALLCYVLLALTGVLPTPF